MKFLLQNVRVYLVLLVSAVLAVTGCNKSSGDDTTQFTPVVTTNNVVVNLTTTSAQSGATISNFLLNTITSYGICWSPTNKSPSVADPKTALTAANVQHFSADVTGLTANTLYYLRGYCVNNDGSIIYGNVIQFTTPTTTFAIAATTTTYAGTGTGGYTEGALRTATFNSPQSLAIDATSGNMYVADAYNNVIRKITSGGVVSTLAGSTTPGYTNGTGTAARFYSPQSVAVDAAGNIYVSDVGNNAIRKITPAGVVTTLAGGVSSGYADATGSSAKFNSPAGLVVDATGNIYVADRGNNMIRKITAAGVVTSIAGTPTAGFIDGLTSLAGFNSPTGIAIDAQGVLYVADLGNNAIRQVTAADGNVTTIAGNPTTGLLLLNLPAGVAVDKNGNIFISDESGRILEIATNKVLYNIAGNVNTAGYVDGAGTAAKFDSPQGITTDAAGNIYVADYNNNVIRKLVVTTKP
jgi:sugar lactone lactonase YvrE